MKEPTIKELSIFLKIIAVNNEVNKLWVYDFMGNKHELPVPNSPTVHSFVADLMLLRSQGLTSILNKDPELFDLSTPLNKKIDSGGTISIKQEP